MGNDSWEERIVRPAEAAIITGRSLASIHRDEAVGRFPKRIRIGKNAVGYVFRELIEWREQCRARNEPARQIVPGPGKRRGRKRQSADRGGENDKI